MTVEDRDKAETLLKKHVIQNKNFNNLIKRINTLHLPKLWQFIRRRWKNEDKQSFGIN